MLLGVPYLAAISLLYYAGYWGVLGIDVYNHFAVSDLIKGAAYPMQLVFGVTMVAAAVDWFFSYVFLLAVRRNKKPLLVFLVGTLLTALAGLLLWQAGNA